MELSTLRWLLEAASLGGVIATLLYLPLRWGYLPREVPVHYGITGRPDRWGARFTLVALPVIALGVYIMISIQSRSLDLLLASDALGESQDAGVMQALMIKACLGWMMFLILRSTEKIANKQAERLNPVVLLLLLAIVLPPLVRAISSR